MTKLKLLFAVTILGAAGVSESASADQYCREYLAPSVMINGVKHSNIYGTACQQPDGAWEIVSQIIDGAGAQPQTYASADQYCREFSENVIIGGRKTSAYGKTCQQPDGSWQVVSEDDAPADQVAQPQYAPVQPQYVESAPVPVEDEVLYGESPVYGPTSALSIGIFGGYDHYERHHDRWRNDGDYYRGHNDSRGHIGHGGGSFIHGNAAHISPRVTPVAHVHNNPAPQHSAPSGGHAHNNNNGDGGNGHNKHH